MANKELRRAAYAVNASASELELIVYEDIGRDPWAEYGVGSKDVLTQLSAFKGQKIRVRINSGGGDAFEGMAIYNLLRNHGAHVVVEVDGLAASAASIIAMAGHEIKVAESAFIMIHKAWTSAWGMNADEMRGVIDMLDKVDGQMAAVYARARSSRGVTCTLDECLDLMAKTTWLTSEDAVALGFADKRVEEAKAAACLRGLDAPQEIQARAAKFAELAATKENHMSDKLFAALGAKSEDEAIAAIEARAARLNLLAQIESKVGKSGEEALGVIVAALAAAAELPAAQAQLGEYQKAESERKRADAIAAAKAEGRLTPAMLDTFVPALASLSDEAFSAALAALPKTLSPSSAREPSAPSAPAAALPDGRTYDDLKPAERAELKRTDAALFETLRAASKRAE